MHKQIPIFIITLLYPPCCLNLDLKAEARWVDTDSSSTTDLGSPGDGSPDHSTLPGAKTVSDSDEPDPVPDSRDTLPPTNTRLDCGSSAEVDDHFCVSLGPGGASIRFQTDEAARVEVAGPIPVVGRVLSPRWKRHHWVFFTGIDGEMVCSVEIGVEDINGNRAIYSVSISGVVGHSIAITEILADPLGLEPSQEFIEIYNYGGEVVELSGWMIDDNGDKNGDLLPPSTTLAPNDAAIIVGPKFDSQGGNDPPPEPGTQLIVLEGTIGSSGLKNTAVESIQLYDADGNLVSAYPGGDDVPGEGVSIERVIAELPDDDPLAFRPNPESASTPGRVPTLQSVVP